MKVLMLLSKEVLMDVRVSTEARTLVDAGHEVIVICWDKYAERPHYEIADGIEIHRIRVNKRGVKNLITKLLHNLKWWRKAYKKGMELYEKGNKFDAIHCHDLDTLPIGVLLKKKLHSKLVYDAHEIFEYMFQGFLYNIPSKIARWMDNYLTKWVDYIITANEPMIKYFQRIRNKPIMGLINCIDPPTNKYIPSKNDVFTLSYCGLMTRNRFFPDIVELVGEEMEDIKLVLASKKEAMYDEIKEISKRYDNIEFLGTISREEVIKRTLKADATFVFANPNHIKMKYNIFGKQLEALACGRPIICTKGTWSGEFTEKHKCGITAEYNKESIKKAILTLKNNPELREELGRNAFKLAKEKYNWRNEQKKLLRVYKELQKDG